MRVVTSAEIDAALTYPKLVDVMEAAFRAGAIAPPRHHHSMKMAQSSKAGGAADATLLLMPAWTASAPGADTAGRYLGVKVVSVFPDNGARGLPAVQGAYLLMSGETGQPLALMDAPRLTVWRTAAASALASRCLSRPDASRLLLVGAGALGAYLVRAHASVRPIREVLIWNRTRAGAEKLAAELSGNSGVLEIVAVETMSAPRTAASRSSATTTTMPSLLPLNSAASFSAPARVRFQIDTSRIGRTLACARTR